MLLTTLCIPKLLLMDKKHINCKKSNKNYNFSLIKCQFYTYELIVAIN